MSGVSVVSLVSRCAKQILIMASVYKLSASLELNVMGRCLLRCVSRLIDVRLLFPKLQCYLSDPTKKGMCESGSGETRNENGGGVLDRRAVAIVGAGFRVCQK